MPPAERRCGPVRPARRTPALPAGGCCVIQLQTAVWRRRGRGGRRHPPHEAGEPAAVSALTSSWAASDAHGVIPAATPSTTHAATIGPCPVWEAPRRWCASEMDGSARGVSFGFVMSNRHRLAGAVRSRGRQWLRPQKRVSNTTSSVPASHASSSKTSPWCHHARQRTRPVLRRLPRIWVACVLVRRCPGAGRSHLRPVPGRKRCPRSGRFRRVRAGWLQRPAFHVPMRIKATRYCCLRRRARQRASAW